MLGPSAEGNAKTKCHYLQPLNSVLGKANIARHGPKVVQNEKGIFLSNDYYYLVRRNQYAQFTASAGPDYYNHCLMRRPSFVF